MLWLFFCLFLNSGDVWQCGVDLQQDSKMIMLELQNVEIGLNGRRLFKPVNLKVAAGEIVTIMGPSGCGKSTLLAFVSGALSSAFSYSGQVMLNSEPINDLPMERRRIGILFQDDLLFPHMNVEENLMFAIPHFVQGEQRREKVRAALERGELVGFEKRDIATLSGGQKARISLLRTLLAEPRAVLLDEPFSRLDEKLKENFRSFVKRQIESLKIPALLVTHDAADVAGEQLLQLV